MLRRGASGWWVSVGALLVVLTARTTVVMAQCPWQREVPDLQNSCLCAYNLGQELSVQCDQVSSDGGSPNAITQTHRFPLSPISRLIFLC